MSIYRPKSSLDELRAKRPGTRPTKQIRSTSIPPPKHTCWMPQNPGSLYGMIELGKFPTLRATCASSRTLCKELMCKAKEVIHGDYPALYALERVS